MSKTLSRATFLVLVRKAFTIKQRELLGNWLYGVAYRIASKARVTTARRSKREQRMQDVPGAPQVPEDMYPDWQPHLDEELRRLPEKYRVPVILCELEGRTRKEVARLLQLPEGTLSSRLATARQLLAWPAMGGRPGFGSIKPNLLREVTR